MHHDAHAAPGATRTAPAGEHRLARRVRHLPDLMSHILLLLILSTASACSRSSPVDVAQPRPQKLRHELKNDDQRTTVTVRVNPETGAFEEHSLDGTVRQVTFHGVNYVRKGAPYIADTLECGGGGTQPACPPPVPCPGLEPCPSTFLLTDADAALLVKRGINAVRIGLMWPGAMPIGPDAYNTSYFAQVEKVIDLLWKHRIYSILDLHQDLLSPRLCGEGAPVWANFTQAALGGLQLPLPVGKTALPMLPSGLPNCSGSKPFPNFYSADLVGRSFDAIYNDMPPQRLGTQLANLWGEVARNFGQKDGVLAYELMNEPAIGDAVEHPELQLHPERADRAQLSPFYAKLEAAIREHDNITIVLYSSIEVGNFLSSPVGFEAGPGGHEYDDRQALVFHDYCVFGTDGPGPTPGPQRQLCNHTDGLLFATRTNDRKRLRTALFMTEFGATFSGANGLFEINAVATLAEAQTPPVSWAFWAWDAFKGQYDKDTPYWDSISRSFAPAVDGTLERISGANRLSQRFELVFTTGKKRAQSIGSATSARTDVYFAPGLANTTLVVTPKGSVEVNGWPSTKADAHSLTLVTLLPETRVTLVIEKLHKIE